MARFDENRFKTENQKWETPQEFFDLLNKEFNFNFDLSADKENKKCDKYFNEKDDALSKEWSGMCWLNPPYGGGGKNSLKNWVKK